MQAAAAVARVREADVTFLVQKLMAAEQQLRSAKGDALLLASAAVSSPHSQSLHSAFLHKAAEAERTAPLREVASAHVDDGIAVETLVLQQLLPTLQSSSEHFNRLHASICQVSALPDIYCIHSGPSQLFRSGWPTSTVRQRMRAHSRQLLRRIS